MFPKFSQPLTKSIRTLEGVLVVAANVALVVIPIVHGGLSPHEAATLGTTLDAVYVGSRSLLKGVAVFGVQTGLTPQSPVTDTGLANIEADAAALAKVGVPILEHGAAGLESSITPDPQQPAVTPTPAPGSTPAQG